VPLAQTLADFQAGVSQCERLIANAHRMDANGAPMLPNIDQEQITVAAFLNMYLAWEAFLESSITKYMTGEIGINGNAPTKYVSPVNVDLAMKMIIGPMRFFDFANHHNVQKMVRIYFDQGAPYEPHISGVYSDLEDLRTMRNASAHISSTTQTALESLAQRIFRTPRPGIKLYELLTSIDPRSTTRGTVFVTYRDKLLAAAHLIAHG
jgi:hypothetical protein